MWASCTVHIVSACHVRFFQSFCFSGIGTGAGQQGVVDCSAGCDMRGQGLVCGADGMTYHGECVAVCQSVTVVRQGPCKTDDAALFDPATMGVFGTSSTTPGKGLVSLDELNR